MKKNLWWAGLLVLAIGSVQAGGLYRWVDKSGNVHYGDVPTEEAAQIEQKKFGTAPETADADLPYATRLARQNFPVTLYVFTDCGDPCQQARDFLKKRGVPFAEKNLTTKEDIDDFKRKSGVDTAPTLSVGKDWLKGFETGQWNSELDIAGYPKTAPYRPQVPSATPPSKPAAKN
jgi:glutaredoxin